MQDGFRWSILLLSAMDWLAWLGLGCGGTALLHASHPPPPGAGQ